jgi:membrane protein required for colicin V production
MIGPLTYLDAALLAVALISGLLAMYRGLTREVLSILSWAAAAGSAVYFVLNYKTQAADLAKQLPGSPPPVVAQVIGGGIVFLLVLIVVHLITSRISDGILDSRIGMIDRILGFAFGVVRGFVLIVVPYMFFAAFYETEETKTDPSRWIEKTHPVWLRDAKSFDLVRNAGLVIRSTLERVKLPGGDQPRGGA